MKVKVGPRVKAVGHLKDLLGKHADLFHKRVGEESEDEGVGEDALKDKGSLKKQKDGSWTGVFPAAVESFSAAYPEEADDIMKNWASKITKIPLRTS